MADFTLDDDDRGSNASSDNEQEFKEFADADEPEDMEIDQEGEADGEGEDDDEDDGDDDQDGEEDEDSPGQPLSQVRRPSLSTEMNSSDDAPAGGQINGVGPTSHPHPSLVRTSASPRQTSAPLQSPKIRYEVRPEALEASVYDIVPTMAAPQGTSINAIAATPDMRYWFSGGSDCYIRKYDGVATVNGKTPLTVAQRHPFVESVTKCGVMMSYWDNEEPAAKSHGEDPLLSPVYSLAVQSQALWMLSGLESGSINLYSVRHDEGKRITYMHQHKSAVSVLTLAQDEKSVLSGSWDKNIFDWDLNTGQVKRTFEGSGGQISAIEVRPASSLPVPEESGDPIPQSQTLSSNNGSKPLPNGTLANGTNGMNGLGDADGTEDAPGSPTNSLFGDDEDNNSLFGETAAENAPSGGVFGDDDDEFSRAIESGLDNPEPIDPQGDLPMLDAPTTTLPASAEAPAPSLPNGESNGHLVEISDPAPPPPTTTPSTQDAVATSETTFLAASIDGTLRIWDRRQPNPVARIPTRTGVPPWCMAACWSPDGNFFYAGRRNGTVEEFSIHKGLKTAERTFKFPQGSGAVSAVRAMPNGRHLIWYVIQTETCDKS